MITNRQTNGYRLNKKAIANINQWREYLTEKFNDHIKRFDIFYWSSSIAFCDVHLNNGHYGQFVINGKSVHFNGHTASHEEYRIFTKATKNDECYKGELI